MAEPGRTAAQDSEPGVSWCPSGLPDRPESVVLGVRSGEDGSVAYLAEPVPAAEVIGLVPEGVEPRRVLRFASHCEADCVQRVGSECGLVNRIVALPDPAPGSGVPRCHLRTQCKWWRQSGVDACRRCPAVVSLVRTDDDLGNLVADPATTREQLEAWVAAADG
ncbi:hypothetical protein [Streptacidiphilus sp. PB12-B1b]|uniref:hypothetical protein n=1 Tax=Streptacidiphilus sp. PB12-B1b TaxID=2705012 RepID=UPI001CDBBCF6|nr:hypothetical protein [Streptacidiphilus sp. PB12-B1b]